MAENKNKIIVYRDWHTTFDPLSNEEAGKLIKHFFRYVNDLNPEAPDRLTQLLFEPIKQTLKRDLKKYEAKCLINKMNGSLGGRPKEEPKETETNRTVILETQPNPEKPDSDSDSDSDTLLPKTWKEDYQVYLKECKEGYRCFMEDIEALKIQQRLNPNVNIKLSVEKGFINFWGTEAGWKHKKKSRTKVIDWKSTIINSIEFNKVYLPKQ